MSFATDFDIALSQLDGATQADAIVKLVNEWYDMEGQNRLMRAAVWMQNIHFLAGDQWLRWNDQQKRWASIPVTQANRSIDRPVSNYILVYTNTNASTFTNKPTMSVDQNSEDPRDKTSAQVANVVKDYLWEELDKDEMYDEAALWGLSTGVAFRKSCKIPSGRKIPVEIPPDHPTYAAEAAKQGTDKPLKAITEKKVYAEIVPPFNLTFDGMAKRFKDCGAIMECQIRRIEWIKMSYAGEGNGYTGKVDEVKDDPKLTNLLTMGESLRDIIEGNTTTGYGKSPNEIKNANVVKEVYVRPTEKHPRGRMIVVAGEVLLYDSAMATKPGSPYFYNDGKTWHPYTYWIYQPLPGSVYGISLIQQLIPKQRTINSIDALAAYNRKTIGVGQWLIPSMSNIPDESIVGVPGQNVTYTPGPRGEKPEKVQGTPLPQQVYDERNLALADMDRIANSADVRTGQNPKGVTTVGQLMILNENARQAMAKPVDRWEKFIERSETLDLLNFQSVYIEPDEYTIKKLTKLSKDVTGTDWATFIGEELRDNVNVRVEKGSTIAKSRVVMQEMILNLAKAGLLPDVLTDPYQHKLLLEKFGVSDLLTESEVDVKKAEKVIELMLQGQYPPVEAFDNPDVQIIVLARFMKQPKFMEYPATVRLLFKRRFDEYAAALARANAVPDNAPEPKPAAGAPGEPVAGKPGANGKAAGIPSGKGPKSPAAQPAGSAT
ncbi:MAG: hypothetical protein MOGMAGMI_02305 [Candidatus Omnitrophica bacterium]|nr:hypothetical protein [Candidatus Omnitrophota bacterium]